MSTLLITSFIQQLEMLVAAIVYSVGTVDRLEFK